MKLAYRVTAAGITSVVAANTRSRAVYAVLRSVRDAGYKVGWTDVRARRAKEYDEWAEVATCSTPWDETMLPKNGTRQVTT